MTKMQVAMWYEEDFGCYVIVLPMLVRLIKESYILICMSHYIRHSKKEVFFWFLLSVMYCTFKTAHACKPLTYANLMYTLRYMQTVL